jgi:O-antigen/teichoic acid export membrane protein
MSYISIAGAFAFTGLGTSLELSASNDIDGNLLKITKQKIKLSLISSTILIAFAYYHYFIRDTYDIAICILTTSVLFPFYIVSGFWQSWANGKREFKKLSLFGIFNGLVVFIGVFVILNLFKDFKLIFSLIFSLNIAINLVILFHYFKKRENIFVDNEMIRYGYKLSGAYLINSLLSFDKFLIDRYLSIETVAVYSIAMVFPDMIKMLFSIFNKLLIPKFAKNNRVIDVWLWFRKYYYGLIILFIILGITGFLSISYLVNIFFGDKYAESVIYSKWLWLIISLAVPPSLLSNILTYHKKTKYVYLKENINVFIKFGGYLLLIPKYGLFGIVYTYSANLVFSSLFIVLSFIYYKKNDTLNITII